MTCLEIKKALERYIKYIRDQRMLKILYYLAVNGNATAGELVNVSNINSNNVYIKLKGLINKEVIITKKIGQKNLVYLFNECINKEEVIILIENKIKKKKWDKFF